MNKFYKNIKIKGTSVAMVLAFNLFTTHAQTTVIDFETFTLSPNSVYSPSATIPFQTPEVSFQYKYSGGYWSGGFAYTNITNSTTAGYTNMFGVRAFTGYTNSTTFVVGQSNGVINLSAPQSTVNGFYVTNTTYAYLSILNGDQFSRKFGDTTGTGAGTTIAQGSYPDYFKLIVKGYKNGTLKADSSTLMLADYTFTNNTQDFVLSTWQFVNTSNLGQVDSLKFFLRSTDNGDFGMNTPAFFAIDNFSVSKPDISTGIGSTPFFQGLSIYPNPFSSVLNINTSAVGGIKTSLSIFDMAGRAVWKQEITEEKTSMELNNLERGVYFIELVAGDGKTITKIIKN